MLMASKLQKFEEIVFHVTGFFVTTIPPPNIKGINR